MKIRTKLIPARIQEDMDKIKRIAGGYYVSLKPKTTLKPHYIKPDDRLVWQMWTNIMQEKKVDIDHTLQWYEEKQKQSEVTKNGNGRNSTQCMET